MPIALMLYNPNSGRNHARNLLDIALEKYSKAGWELHFKRSNYAGDIPEFFATNDLICYDAILAVGGDGTINEVVSAMHRHKLDRPLGIVACGTVNDFVQYLKLPTDRTKCFDFFLEGKTERIDLGLANGHPFINVCAVGLFSHGYMEYSPELKRRWGKAAYYVKGATDSVAFKPSTLRLTTDNGVYEGQCQMVLALNGTGTGGFGNISPQSSACAGLLDFVVIKATPATAIPALFFKVLNGDMTNDSNVAFFRTKKLIVEDMKDSKYFRACDLDGDRGPELPLAIEVCPSTLEVYSNR